MSDTNDLISGVGDKQPEIILRSLRLRRLQKIPADTRLAQASPPPPSIFKAATAGAETVQFDWNVVVSPIVVGYNVYRNVSNNSGAAQLIDVVPQNPKAAVSLHYVDAIGKDATVWYWVSSVNKEGNESVRVSMQLGNDAVTTANAGGGPDGPPALLSELTDPFWKRVNPNLITTRHDADGAAIGGSFAVRGIVPPVTGSGVWIGWQDPDGFLQARDFTTYPTQTYLNLFIDGIKCKINGNSAGPIGLGGDINTGSIVQIAQGNTGKVPLKFVSGNLKTAPLAGGMEWNGSNLFFTEGSGTRRALDPVQVKGQVYTHDSSGTAALTVGSNGQVLTADSTQATGLKWAAAGSTSPLTTKGDIYTFGSADAREPVSGTNGSIPVEDSAKTNGWSWKILGTGYAGIAPPYLLGTDGNYYHGQSFQQVTLPSLTTFSWGNQTADGGTATVTTGTYGDMVLTLPKTTTNSLQIRGRFITAPSTPYLITIKMKAFLGGNSGAGAGLYFRDSGGGKIVAFALYTTNNPTTWGFAVSQYTNYSTFSSNPTLNTLAGNGDYWMRVKDDGTDLTCWLSPDNSTFIKIHTEARHSWLAAGPDEVGWFGNAGGLDYVAGGVAGDTEATVQLLSWKQT